MSRRFTPLGVSDVRALAPGCPACVYWETDKPLEVRCAAACDGDIQREWFVRVHEEWGECGRVAREGDDVLGFIKYAPARYFPQAVNLPVRPPDWNAPLIACMHIRDDARGRELGRLLLHSALRDLHGRGERCVYSYAVTRSGDIAEVPMVSVDFLMRHGFVTDRAHPEYPLLRLDLRTLAALAEPLEAVLESLRIPLRRPGRVPTPSVEI